MALLSIEARQKRFKALGLGEYNKANILKFQKMAFPDHKDQWDGIYGKNTDNALRTFYNCSLVKNFKPEEFRCNCGKCCGYPSYMKQVELKHLQKIRDHYGKPMTITSGLRCANENARVGGVANSGHLNGYAADFYMPGVTETVSQRNAALKYMASLPNHQFTYGANMVDSEGNYRTASGMGNAMHTETHKPAKVDKTKSKYYNKTVRIGEARATEKGTLYNGKAGDQKGGEVGMGNWYNGSWTHVFRAKDKATRLKLAQAMMDTCNNNNIGYDASSPDRYTAWDLAEKNGHDIKGISKKCETTCSQAVSMCLRAVGTPKTYAPRHADIAAIKPALLNNPELKTFTSKAYTASSDKLQPGDILLNSHHVLIVVQSPNVPTV